VAGEITGSNSGVSLWTNSELALEGNVLSKWHKQGTLYNKYRGSIIHSKIDRNRYEIKIIGNNIRKERITIHPTITTRILLSSYRTFALNFDQNSDYIQ
jgi:hypothetical protein